MKKKIYPPFRQQSKEKLFKEGYSTAATIASEDEQKVDSVMMDEEDESPPQRKQAWIDQEEISERLVFRCIAVCVHVGPLP